MSQLIQDNEGCIDKYIGDVIMAIWNAPETVIDHPINHLEQRKTPHSDFTP